MPVNQPTLKRLYLASRNPRRRELLHQIGVSFETLLFRSGERADSQVNVTPLGGEKPIDYVQRIARAKAGYGGELVAARRLVPLPVLAASTALELDAAMIGKPLDGADAVRILSQLGGRSHRVFTSVAVCWGGHIDCVLSCSEVTLRPLTQAEIERYVRTGEPREKPGAYAMQGRAAAFIERLDGSYTGVMGLPLCETASLLNAIGFEI